MESSRSSSRPPKCTSHLGTGLGVHPSQIQAWKKALTEEAAGVFSDGQERKAKSDASPIVRLYQEIGQLKVERDFLAERSGP